MNFCFSFFGEQLSQFNENGYAIHVVVGSVVWLQPHHRTNHNDVFSVIILITITLASSNNTLPDDGD